MSIEESRNIMNLRIIREHLEYTSPNNIVVHLTVREQIAELCKKDAGPIAFGFEIYTSEWLPENAYVLRQGNKVIAVGTFETEDGAKV